MLSQAAGLPSPTLAPGWNTAERQRAVTVHLGAPIRRAMRQAASRFTGRPADCLLDGRIPVAPMSLGAERARAGLPRLPSPTPLASTMGAAIGTLAAPAKSLQRTDLDRQR